MKNYSKDVKVGPLTVNFKKIFDDLANNEQLSFNAAQATACITSLQQQSCDGSHSNPLLSGPCQQIYEGTLKAGEACTNTVECLPNHACIPDKSGNKTCVAMLKEGEDCSGIGKVCGTDLRCDLTSKKCAKKKKEGDDCKFGECETGLSCKSGKCAKSTTAPPTKLCP